METERVHRRLQGLGAASLFVAAGSFLLVGCYTPVMSAMAEEVRTRLAASHDGELTDEEALELSEALDAYAELGPRFPEYLESETSTLGRRIDTRALEESGVTPAPYQFLHSLSSRSQYFQYFYSELLFAEDLYAGIENYAKDAGYIEVSVVSEPEGLSFSYYRVAKGPAHPISGTTDDGLFLVPARYVIGYENSAGDRREEIVDCTYERTIRLR